jgi:hypothetical protein
LLQPKCATQQQLHLLTAAGNKTFIFPFKRALDLFRKTVGLPFKIPASKAALLFGFAF